VGINSRAAITAYAVVLLAKFGKNNANKIATFYGKARPVDTGFTLSPIVHHPAQYKELYTNSIFVQIRLSD